MSQKYLVSHPGAMGQSATGVILFFAKENLQIWVPLIFIAIKYPIEHFTTLVTGLQIL